MTMLNSGGGEEDGGVWLRLELVRGLNGARVTPVRNLADWLLCKLPQMSGQRE